MNHRTAEYVDLEQDTRAGASWRVMLVPGCLIAAAFALGVFARSNGPTSDDVCEHMLDVLGDTDLIVCRDAMESRREQMGGLAFRNYATCVLAADTFSGLAACRRD